MEKNEICAVVVTYNPDDKIDYRIVELARQVKRVVIVDNGSRSESFAKIVKAATQAGAHLIRNDTNRGIAFALNQGVAYAVESGFEWILFLDQDTIPSKTMVEDLMKAWKACPFRERVGAVGASFITVKGKPSSRCTGRLWVEATAVITSGMMCPLAAFKAVGPFRNDFFIDYVDTEWCLRLRAHSYRVIVASKPVMVHSVGRSRVHRFLWTTVAATHHNALRRYYITRNRVIVWRQYLKHEPRFVLKDTVSFLKEGLKIVLYESDKGKKLIAILLGLGHAVSGKSGELKGKISEWLGRDVTRWESEAK